MSDIFISYANADRPRVGPLVEALEQRGWSVWWDRTILPGKTWDRAIETALAECRCVVVLWSQDSIQSDWVKAEAEEARQRGTLIPALLDNVNIPLEFRRVETANLTDWPRSLPSAGLDDLVRAISAVLSPGAPRPLAADTGASANTGLPPVERAGSSLGILILVGVAMFAAIAGVIWYFAAGHREAPAARTAAVGQPDANAPGDKPDETASSPSSPTSSAPDDSSGNAPGGRRPAPKRRKRKPDKAAESSKASPAAAEAVDFSGAWKADLNYLNLWQSAREIYHETFLFAIDGDEVTGSASLLGIPRTISEGKVHGHDISFVTRFPLTEGTQENRYSGKISGDRIEFQYQDASDGRLIPFTAVRVKP